PRVLADARPADVLVAQTRFGVQQLRRVFGPEARIERVPCGVDPTTFYPLAVGPAIRPAPVDIRSARARARAELFPERRDLQDASLVLNHNRDSGRKRVDVAVEGFARFVRHAPIPAKLCLRSLPTRLSDRTIETVRALHAADQLLVLVRDGDPAIPDTEL